MTNSDARPTVPDRLLHIIEAIDGFQQVSSAHTREDLGKDRCLYLALERSYEIVYLASRYIPPELQSGYPATKWERIADFGNRLLNADQRADLDLLLLSAAEDFPPLRDFAVRILEEEGSAGA